MDRRSTEGMAGEWRKQGLSGHLPCRTSMGAACRGGVLLASGSERKHRTQTQTANTDRQSAKVLLAAGQRSASVATWPIGSVCPLEAAGKFYVFLDVVLAEGRISAAHWVNESGPVSRTSRNNAWLSSENTKEKGQNPRRCWVFWPSCEYLKNSITCSKWWCSVCYRTTRYWDQ